MFDPKKLTVYFRDEYVPFEQANISILNTSFLYGLGVFTGMRSFYNSEKKCSYVFRPDAHYERFVFGCKLMRYENFLKDYDYKKFLGIIEGLHQRNNIDSDAYIRINSFSDEDTIAPKLIGYKDSICGFLYPLQDYIPLSGVRCKVSSWRRIEDNAMPARAKINGSYVNTALTKSEALISGYDEAIVLDNNNHVVEGSAENIFLVINDVLYTPSSSSSILEGINRASVIEIAKDLGMEVVERDIDRTELIKAQEIFLTGTGAKICPVIEVDDYKVGDGKPGTVCTKIREIYQEICTGQSTKYSDWVVSI